MRIEKKKEFTIPKETRIKLKDKDLILEKGDKIWVKEGHRVDSTLARSITYILFDASSTAGEELEFQVFLQNRYPKASVRFENPASVQYVKIGNKSIEEVDSWYENPDSFLNLEWEAYC